MKSSTPGSDISEAEVVHIHAHGIWVAVGDREYSLPFKDFPWFREARISDVLNVQLHHGHHLHWPDLDVDLSLDSLEDPSRYPLIAG